MLQRTRDCRSRERNGHAPCHCAVHLIEPAKIILLRGLNGAGMIPMLIGTGGAVPTGQTTAGKINQMSKKIMDKDYQESDGTFGIKFPDGQSIAGSVADLGGKTTEGGYVVPFGSIAMMALLHGINQKIGDAASGAKGDADAAYESCLTVFEQVKGGEWNKKREGGEGTRPSLVVEAVIRAKTAAGLPVDAAAIAAKYSGKDGEENRKNALANPQVKAAYEALRAEAAQKRAAEAAAKAGNAPAPDLGNI